MTTRCIRGVLIAALCLAALPAPAQTGDDAAFDAAASRAERDLQAALAELAALRETIADQKLPLNRELRQLESDLTAVRAEFQDASATLDSQTLDLTNVSKQIQGRRDEQTYLQSLLDEYVRNFQTRLHIAEQQRYDELVEAARTAPESANLTPAEKYATQLDLLQGSVDRIEGLLGGERFAGTAVDPTGEVRDVEFALIGPVALFRTADGRTTGLAIERLNSASPNMVDLTASGGGVGDLIATGSGQMAFDPTLGDAEKIGETEETIAEHIGKGGLVMIPILLLAAASLIVAMIKWIQLARVREPSKKRVKSLLESVKARRWTEAVASAEGMSGPTGEMLRTGLEHRDEPKELIEELMFERTLETKLRLQRFLSFIAVSAAAAPLLGLLGTVTGIINTFKMITVYGTGDAKTLSGGISEALITTEFGLIVAIPALLLHAFLSRKAKRMLDGMEKSAVSFLNRMPPDSARGRELDDGEDTHERSGGGSTERLAPAGGLAIERGRLAELDH